MGALKLRKGTFKHAEDELMAYHDTRKKIMQLRNEILYNRTSEDENVGGGRSSTPSDPTGRTATALMTNRQLAHLEGVICAIESVYHRLPPDKQRLVNMVYWTKPQLLSWDGIVDKMHIGRSTAFRWRDEIIYALADELGWR